MEKRTPPMLLLPSCRCRRCRPATAAVHPPPSLLPSPCHHAAAVAVDVAAVLAAITTPPARHDENGEEGCARARVPAARGERR